MKILIGIVITILCLIGYTRSATRLSVYTSSDCSNSSLIGFINAPALYPAGNYRSIGCTPSSDGQYYDIKKGLDEFDLRFSPVDWSFNYLLVASISIVGSSCSTMDETIAVTYAVKPDVCMNTGPFSVAELDNATSSIKFPSCVANASDIVLADIFGCAVQSFSMQNATCAPDTNNNLYLGFFCSPPPTAPVTTTVPSTEPAVDPNTPGTAPTMTPTTTPISGPISIPTNVPAAVTTPAKVSSASLTSLSVVSASVVVFSLFL